MSTITPTTPAPHKDSAVTTVVKDAAFVVGGLSWSAIMLIVGLTAIAIGIIAVPVMFFTTAGVTGEVIHEAAELTGQEPQAPVANTVHPNILVKPDDPNNISHADPTSNYRGSAETPEAFPRVHGTD
jgi:hypothetical protein